MKISIGCDHAGFTYKELIKEHLNGLEHTEVIDRGTTSGDSVDYPDFAHLVASDVDQNRVDFGILICGSANGVSMTANKHEGVRCAICWTKEITSLARSHNNANIIALPARFISTHQAIDYVNVFLHTAFEGGRHQRRVEKISCI